MPIHPGWANEAQRGTIACTPSPACKYSDHRFVWHVSISARCRVLRGRRLPRSERCLFDAHRPDVDGSAECHGIQHCALKRWCDCVSQLATTASPGYSGTNVTENSHRFYRVFATNSGGKSPLWNVSSATTPATPPTQPTNVTATGGKRKITLKWTASTDAGGSGLAGYEIWRSTTGVGGSLTRSPPRGRPRIPIRGWLASKPIGTTSLPMMERTTSALRRTRPVPGRSSVRGRELAGQRRQALGDHPGRLTSIRVSTIGRANGRYRG
jgi:hypothetical protein